jgi:probable F420-dependent oxidoreductase
MGNIDGMDLGQYGVWTFDFEFLAAAQVRDSVQELEDLGWRAVWVPELFGREALTHASLLLAATSRMQVINGIAQIWGRPAKWAYGAALLLADAYPGRHVLGLGFGDARAGASSPLTSMMEYLDELDAMDTPNPAPATPTRRLLAAYGPKMLELARERADGAHVYHVNTQHTHDSRSLLGDTAFLGVEHPVLFETDPEMARSVAREHLKPYLNQKYNVAKFHRLGYSDDEIGHGGSDRIVDDLVFWGDIDTIVGRLQEHVSAGADHVAIQVIGIDPGTSAMPQWRELAGALIPTRG